MVKLMPEVVESLDNELSNAIKENCSSTDYEVNGCELDKLLISFLRHEMEMEQAADAAENVECWRA